MGIGDKKTNRGVLILYAIRDRRVRIEVGYGLEATLPDHMVANFLREANPLMSQGMYDQALSLVTGRVGDTIAASAGVHLTEPASQPSESESNQTPSPDIGVSNSSLKVAEQSVQSLIEEGERYWEQGNYDEAISSFRKE